MLLPAFSDWNSSRAAGLDDVNAIPPARHTPGGHLAAVLEEQGDPPVREARDAHVVGPVCPEHAATG